MKEAEELPEEFEYIDATSNAEFISCAYNAISAIDDMDEALLEAREKTKIRLIRSRSIAIIYKCINELHEELFPPKE